MEDVGLKGGIASCVVLEVKVFEERNGCSGPSVEDEEVGVVGKNRSAGLIGSKGAVGVRFPGNDLRDAGV